MEYQNGPRTWAGRVLPVLLVGLVASMGAAVWRGASASVPPARLAAMASPTAPTRCLGRHDLIVDGVNGGNGLTLSGARTYDRICVRDGGTLVVRGHATLRAGIVYVDTTSHITADGVPGGRSYGTDCAETGNGQPTGDPGGTLLIQAHTAIIQGRITANGGDGYTNAGGVCDGGPGGSGGRGGRITLQADALTLLGTLVARGGNGGHGHGGSGNGRGGGGGTIIVETAQSMTVTTPPVTATVSAMTATAQPMTATSSPMTATAQAMTATSQPTTAGTEPTTAPAPSETATTLPATSRLAAHLDIRGGKDGGTGPGGPRGMSRVAVLTPAQLAALPPAPPPLVTVLGTPPAFLPPQRADLFAATMGCGSGDLTVAPGRTVRLTGSYSYRHVCIRGVLLVGRSLALRARTIMLAPGGRISADGVVSSTVEARDGRYETAGSCGADRTAVHAGVPGAAGNAVPNGIGYTPGGKGGAGGGMVTLEAQRVLLAGTLSANGLRGGMGAEGWGGTPSSGPYPPGRGGGGGSGGGILVRADALQLTGTLAATGGVGGPPGADTGQSGALPAPGTIGSPGCIKLFVSALRAPGPSLVALPVPGPVLIGRTAGGKPLLNSTSHYSR